MAERERGVQDRKIGQMQASWECQGARKEGGMSSRERTLKT